MALTGEDLQAIKGLLQTELQPVKDDISVLKEDVSSLKEDVSTLKQETGALKEDVSSLKEDVSTLREDVTSLKQETLELNRRIDNLELQTKQTEHVLRNEIRKSEYLILDEVERVHAILDKHKSDTTKHTA